jgi:hypothetical protein
VAAIVAAVCALLSLAHIVDPVVVILCGVVGVPLIVYVVRRDGKACAADLKAGTYIRLSGPLTRSSDLGEEGPPDHSFSVQGQKFPISAWTFEELREVPWATVEYAPHSRTLFALYDATGRVMLQEPGYAPPARGPVPAPASAWLARPGPITRPPSRRRARRPMRSLSAARRRAMVGSRNASRATTAG